MKTITLLYASEDASYAQQLERQLLHATNRTVRIRHNDGSIPGNEIAQAWNESLYGSHLFVVLVSADLSNATKKLAYIQQANTLAPDRIVAVYLRPCWIEGGRFEGIAVMPSKPITSYSGYAKEEAWVHIVQHIIGMVAQVNDSDLPIRPVTRRDQVSSSPAKQHPWQRMQEPVEVCVQKNRTVEKKVEPIVFKPEREVQEWDCTLLYASQDERWIPLVERTLRVLQRGIKIRFTILKPADVEQAIEQVQHSRLTLALLSPDFLASDWMEHYKYLSMLLERKEQVIVPVKLRDCQWTRTVSVPRQGAIGKTGNDALWSEVSQEIIAVLRKNNPDDIPPANPYSR